MRTTLLLLTILLCAGVSYPQARPTEVFEDMAPAPSDRFLAAWYPPANDVTTYGGGPVRDLPYVATEEHTSTVTFPRGSNEVKTAVTSGLEARDSKGRLRTETEVPREDASGRIVKAHEVVVEDSVSHCRFVWMEPWVGPGDPAASVQCQPRVIRYTEGKDPGEEIHKISSYTPQAQADGSILEKLPERTYAGMTFVGRRTTAKMKDQTLPPEAKSVVETWFALELHEMISISNLIVSGEDGKPLGGSWKLELKNIRREEPDAALFYPPKGYTITPLGQ